MSSLNPSSRPVRRQPKKLPGMLRWVKRGLKVGVVLAVAGAGVMAWRSGRLQVALDQADETVIAVSAKTGFRVENVEVVGRSQTEPKALLAAAGLNRGDPILAFSPTEARRRIENLPWVESAAVERRLPDTVAITIVERKPIALWQHSEKISLIDAAGAVLGTVSIENAPNLPLIVGGDAPAHASELLQLLAAYPEIGKRVQASSWIGSRRWDLKLDNGVDVRLPETGVAEAMKQLAEAEASSRLLERDVVAVDLRLGGKMIVRLAHELPPPAKPKPQQGI
ncbi:MAG TPA: FtsQ-type POTRA domain-containing protein [Alphaproteobacteria bacterium]|jgi:cell division protein FtsQ|nr:FtsQ-type POTRA domain-containing protein [Alphaproteobacteria bacterium]